LAKAKNTAVRYAAIYCPPQRTKLMDPRFAASRHTNAPINHTRPSHRSP